jgi:TolB-like protein
VQQIQRLQARQQVPQQQQQQTPQKWTGNGGSGMSLAILAPTSTGLAENQSYLPALVQGEFVSNFSGYSAISVLDRQSSDKVYEELLSGNYSDDDAAGLDLGHWTATDYIMTGTITRTATGYNLQIQITKTSDKRITASYSGPFTFLELDNLTGIRRASLDLLQKMGVTLTAQAQGELTSAAAANHVTAQTALAQGITAQRQGTEVAALSYYFQAATYDPSLMEAVNRSSILNANISSGNIGDNVRNYIAWRRDWVARLTETEQFFDSFNRTESMPYTLFYVSNDIKQGTINYQNETVNLSIETHLHGSGIWTVSIERALRAVYDGLDATKRKNDWGLASWPQRGVTNLNAFARRSGNFTVVFELLNDRNTVIGRQTLQSNGSWELSGSGRPGISVSADVRRTLNFQNVNANDISDRMTIRVATINGTDAEAAARNGVLQIRASTKNEFDQNDRFRFSRGVIQGFTNNSSRTANLVIPNNIWGDPVISIGNGAFSGNQLTGLTIPDSVTSIGENAFRNNNINSGFNIGKNVTSIGTSAFEGVFSNDANWRLDELPDGLVSIGAKAFYGNRLRAVIIPNSVRTIGDAAFQRSGVLADRLNGITSITIGANVVMEGNPFQYSYHYQATRDGNTYTATAVNDGFLDLYRQNGRKAGTYTYVDRNMGRNDLFSAFSTDRFRWVYDVPGDNTNVANIRESARKKGNAGVAVTVVLGLAAIAVSVVLLILNPPGKPEEEPAYR